MAFPTTPLDITAELLIGGAWTNITPDVFGENREKIRITRCRQSEGARSDPTRCDLSIRNPTGIYSSRNPLSPYYGLIGRNTPLRVYTGAPHLGAGGGSGTASTSHVAPAVTAAGAGLLICGWMSDDPGNYTPPGGMTAGPAETDGTFSTMRTAYQAVAAAGATGTRTATFSASQGHASVSAVAHGSSVTVQETLSGVSAIIDDIALATGAGTQAGWWLVAVQGWLRGFDAPMPDAPYGDDGGWILLGDSPTITGTFGASTTVYLHTRVWVRRVNVAGGQTVIFPGVANASAPVADNHAALYVLSGVTGWNIRATTEIASWPPRWDSTGADVWVPIVGQGILRRLIQGASPLRSSLRRAITGAGATIHVGASLLPVAYWPIEDASGSTQAASGLPGGTPLIASGAIGWASVESPGSAPLPDWSGSAGTLSGPVSGVASGSNWSVGCMVQLTGATLWTALSVRVADGIYDELRLVLSSTVDVSGVASGTPTTILSSAAALTDGLPHWVEIRATTAGGGNVAHSLWVDGSQVATTTGAGAPGQPARVAALPRTADPAALGHIGVWAPPANATYPAIIGPAITGHNGETAGRRVERLCHEQDIALHLVGDADDTAAMGPQPVATLLDLLRECEEADGGILYEPREALGLAYRTLASLYNQRVALALTYGATGEVLPPIEPVDDDRGTRNDVTASRSGGSSARYEVTSGPLSTQDPPDGVGRYDHSVTVNVQTDGQLPDQAGWQAHLGTWDEARYPTIRVDLAALGKAGKTTLLDAAAALDAADRLTIASPPPWLPPDAIDQHVEGYSEELAQFTWDMRLNCSPAGPWQVATVDGEQRVAVDGSYLAAGVAMDDTTLLVATPVEAPWTTDAADWPVDIRHGGEHMTATAITPRVAPQYVAAGTGTNGNNTNRVPALPAGWAVGDLLLIYATARATPDHRAVAPDGYLTMFQDRNIALFGKIAQAGEVAPTVTYVGGVAGSDTIAQMAAFRGVAPGVMAAASQLNASAQDVSHPPLSVPQPALVLYLGWRQDDWTSVATLPGATEIGSRSGALGDDAAQVWDYRIQTVQANIPAGQFVVTGGAAAISRGAVVALWANIQQLTVVRGVNGVRKAHPTSSGAS